MALALAAGAVVGLAAAGEWTDPALRVEPEVSFALPPPSTSCDGARVLASGGYAVPLTVSVVAGQVAEFLDVCLDGKGPFPFVLDSGAGQSTVDAGLAARLHLERAGPASQFAGVGCTGQAQPVSITTWSLDGVTLAGQTLTSARLPQMGGRGQPVGLLGSDVLSRFGAVRLDFGARNLVLPGAEGEPLSGPATVHGPAGSPDKSLTGGAGSVVPVVVSTVPGDVSLSVAVRFDGGPRRQFVVDSGSSQSVVADAVAHAEGLAGIDLAQRQATVCSVITVPLVRSGPWSVPGRSLQAGRLGAVNFGSAGLNGIDGLLGSDQLRRFGWVVLDYRAALMVTGA